MGRYTYVMETVAKILILDAEDNALILRRNGTHPRYPHEADLPGGEVEDGESEETAVQREAREEAALDIPIESIRFGQRIIHARNDVLYVAHVDTVKPDVKISWEHESYKWVAPRDLEKSLDTKDSYMDVVREYIAREDDNTTEEE